MPTRIADVIRRVAEQNPALGGVLAQPCGPIGVHRHPAAAGCSDQLRREHP